MDYKPFTDEKKKSPNNGEAKRKEYPSHFEKMPMIRSAYERLKDGKNLPKTTKLIGDIWTANELHILFADTGLGKSIFGMQQAIAISKGERLFGKIDNENPPLTTLYYDFEMTDKQFYTRYTNERGDFYNFPENLYIDNPDILSLAENSKSFMETLFQRFRYEIEKLDAKVVFIDNITYLNDNTMQEGQTATEVMKKLKQLKDECDISICVIAHTPKMNITSPITVNNLGGSKMISNFSDSISCLGASKKGSNVRYFKQVKPSRSGEWVYDSQNVIELTLQKHDTILRMRHEGFTAEMEHIGITEGDLYKGKRLDAIELRKMGKSIRTIADELDVSKSTVGDWIKALTTDPGEKIQF